jgi:hypothetical protein
MLGTTALNYQKRNETSEKISNVANLMSATGAAKTWYDRHR